MLGGGTGPSSLRDPVLLLEGILESKKRASRKEMPFFIFHLQGGIPCIT